MRVRRLEGLLLEYRKQYKEARALYERVLDEDATVTVRAFIHSILFKFMT